MEILTALFMLVAALVWPATLLILALIIKED